MWNISTGIPASTWICPWHKTEMFILEGTEEELQRGMPSMLLDKSQEKIKQCQ